MKEKEIEIWRAIPGYETFYQVSSMGRIKSLDRIDSTNRRLSSKILALPLRKGGYHNVGLNMGGVQKRYSVHQLVAMAFLDHTPCGNRRVVDHINGIKTDNRVENLQLISSRENSSKDKKGYTSKYTGVSWNKKQKKWRAAIQINGKIKHLGTFTDELEAAKIYKDALESINNNEEVKTKIRVPKGAHKVRNRWRASYKNKHLGYFNTELEASQAYQKALKDNLQNETYLPNNK